jgi:RNA polymerase sigma-70 factor (ECF subfamily)
MKSLKDGEAANDIVQDSYLKLWQHRKQVDPQKVKSWLFAVAHNAMINYIKVESRKRSLDDSGDESKVYQNHHFDTKAIVDKALDTLPAQQKSIILLRDLEGYRYDEIAEILQISESQVKVYLFRARVKIKIMLKSLMHVL